jgi:hypothetical protein
MRASADHAEGCAPQTLAQVAACAHAWRAGGEPEALPRVLPALPAAGAPRDVFVLFIGGDKEKAPAAAVALQKAL